MATDRIDAVFFDLGDTLGTPVLTPAGLQLEGFNVFPFAPPVLQWVRDRGLRNGIISNTGEDPGSHVNQVLRAAGLLDFFEPALLVYSKDVGVTKTSPAIFQLAAARAGLAGDPRSCLYVGEDAKE